MLQTIACSVCVFATNEDPGKAAVEVEPIEMPFGSMADTCPKIIRLVDFVRVCLILF